MPLRFTRVSDEVPRLQKELRGLIGELMRRASEFEAKAADIAVRASSSSGRRGVMRTSLARQNIRCQAWMTSLPQAPNTSWAEEPTVGLTSRGLVIECLQDRSGVLGHAWPILSLTTVEKCKDAMTLQALVGLADELLAG